MSEHTVTHVGHVGVMSSSCLFLKKVHTSGERSGMGLWCLSIRLRSTTSGLASRQERTRLTLLMRGRATAKSSFSLVRNKTQWLCVAFFHSNFSNCSGRCENGLLFDVILKVVKCQHGHCRTNIKLIMCAAGISNTLL